MVEMKNRKPKDRTNISRQRRRLERLRAVLFPLGWDSESELMTAIINGTVQAPKNPRVYGWMDGEKI